MPLQSKILANSFSAVTRSRWQPVSDGTSLQESGGQAAGIHQAQRHHDLVQDIYARGLTIAPDASQPFSKHNK